MIDSARKIWYQTAFGVAKISISLRVHVLTFPFMLYSHPLMDKSIVGGAEAFSAEMSQGSREQLRAILFNCNKAGS